MSTRKSILMMSNSGNEFNLVGEPIRADSYFGYTDGLHTTQFTYMNFTGGLGIQGTLSLGKVCDGKVEIPEEDWFWIHLTDARGNCSEQPFMTYPKDPLRPTGSKRAQSTALTSQGDSGTEAFTFVGNFTYLRAVITRDYINPPPQPQADGRWFLGAVDRVLLSI